MSPPPNSGEVSLGVAIPSYGHASFVREALKSLERVSFPFEAVIQDGGSPADVLAEIRSVISRDDRFRLVTEEDSGQADAINRAWRRLLPRHPFVTWLNTDDLAHPHGLSAALDVAVRTPDASVVYGDLLIIDEDGLVVEMLRRPRRITRLQLVYNESLVSGVLPVIRSSAVREVGLLDERLRYSLDYDLFIRLTGVGSAVRTPHIVGSFRVHEASKTSGVEFERAEREASRVRRRYQRLPPSAAAVVRKVLRAKIRLQRMAGDVSMVERWGDREPHLQREA